jgi:acetyltransferase-like isoleucine patch superfamily enzyme
MEIIVLKSVVKTAWRLKREFSSMMRWIYYALLTGAFFKSLGWGTHFFGRVRFGSVEGNITVGRKCWIGHEVFISASRGAFINIENGCSFNTGCHIVAVYGIAVGSNTWIGEYCSIRDQNHKFDSVETPIKKQGFYGAPIKIGKDVWIGRGVFVGPGVEIGDGAVIGANSVVTKSIPPFVVAVGSPAKVIRMRNGHPS